MRQREGDESKGAPLSAKIGRGRFEDAAEDLLADYEINGKRSHENLKNTIVDGALEPWFRGRRMASLTTAGIRAYVADRKGRASRTRPSTGNSQPSNGCSPWRFRRGSSCRSL